MLTRVEGAEFIKVPDLNLNEADPMSDNDGTMRLWDGSQMLDGSVTSIHFRFSTTSFINSGKCR